MARNATTGKREIDVSGALIGKMFPTVSANHCTARVPRSLLVLAAAL